MNSNSLTHQFRQAYAKNAVENMLDAIGAIGANAGRVTGIALGVSMPHQIAYLLSQAIPHMHWNSPSAWLDSIGMILLAIAAPVVTDLLILMCIKTIGASAASRFSKIRAFVILGLAASVSAIVNFLAPAPLVIKLLAGFVVLAVPMGEALRFIKPDFNAMEALETEIATTAPAAKPGRVISKQEMKARKRAGYDGMTAAQKRTWTKNYKPRGAKPQLHPVQQIQALTNVAPVSPAPMSA